MLRLFLLSQAVFALPDLFRHQFFPTSTGFYTLPGLSRTSPPTLYFTPFTNLTQPTSIPIPSDYAGLVGAGCTLVQDCIYCFGGFRVNASSLLTYDGLIPANQLMWSLNLTSKVWQTLAPGVPAFFYSALAIPSRASLLLSNTSVRASSDIYIYAGPTGSFTLSPETMMNASVLNKTSLAPFHLESGCMLATPTGGLYIGGTTPSGTSSTVFAINTTTLAWTALPTNLTTATSVGAPGLSAMTCSIKGTDVYVYGGTDGAYSGTMYHYDVVYSVWRVVGGGGVGGPGLRVWAASVVLGKYVMVHGGLRADNTIECSEAWVKGVDAVDMSVGCGVSLGLHSDRVGNGYAVLGGVLGVVVLLLIVGVVVMVVLKRKKRVKAEEKKVVGEEEVVFVEVIETERVIERDGENERMGEKESEKERMGDSVHTDVHVNRY